MQIAAVEKEETKEKSEERRICPSQSSERRETNGVCEAAFGAPPPTGVRVIWRLGPVEGGREGARKETKQCFRNSTLFGALCESCERAWRRRRLTQVTARARSARG